MVPSALGERAGAARVCVREARTAEGGVRCMRRQHGLDAWLGQTRDVRGIAAAGVVRGRRTLAPARGLGERAGGEQLGFVRGGVVQIRLCAAAHVAHAAAADGLARAHEALQHGSTGGELGAKAAACACAMLPAPPQPVKFCGRRER
jgi:hypothetical protein